MLSIRYRRFIPAGAGNTQRAERERLMNPVYPRWRGEHQGSSITQLSNSGLSPLARGTHAALAVNVRATRFIPAGAGNTMVPDSSAVTAPVYPRWRGEHPCSSPRAPLRRGLSPLARGTRERNFFDRALQRFIPAGAGNTPLTKPAIKASPVYPRWRGEHQILPSTAAPGAGLSPLARGTH